MPRRRKAVAVLNQSLFAVVREFERFRVSFAREAGLTVTDLRALARVVEGGEHTTPKDLASRLELTTGAVTSLTDRLVAAELITRQANPGDRRSLHLVATAKGKDVMSRVVSAYEELVRAATETVGDDDLEEFAGLLDALVARSQEIANA